MNIRLATLGALVATAAGSPLCTAADSKAFDGLIVGADLKLVSNSIAVNNWVNNVFAAGIGTLDGTGGNEQIPDVTAGYSFTYANAVFGVGGALDLKKSRLLLDPNGEFLGPPRNPVEQKSHFSFYLEPGVQFAGGAAEVYAKAAYHSFKLHDPNAEVAIMDQTFTGIGFGAGLRANFYGYWSVVLEVEQVSYQTKQDAVVNGGNPLAQVKPKSTTGLIGIQYTFNEY